MKHLFIINPAAGKKGGTEMFTRQIESIFASRDHAVLFTSGPEDATRMARDAAREGTPLRIYACGGDGTLNEVVNGAAGYDHVAITNVPTGTGNDFLKIFGPTCRSRFSDLSALADGPQAALDLMDCNGKLGIGSICAGVDARVAADVHRYKSLPLVTGMGAYILALVANVLFKDISRRTTIDVEGAHTESDVAVICVMNGRFYGGGFMPVGEAQPDDGVLDILLVSQVNRLTFFQLVGKYAKGLYKECGGRITDYHCQNISFTTPGADGVACVDGEIMRGASFTVKLAQQKINFFYPADLSYREPGVK